MLSVNESREQTRAIQAAQCQRQTLEGLLADADKTTVLNTHRNAQRLLKPLLVANPYAEQLTFLDAKTRTRCDHVKYLTLIRAIALLHQHQREIQHIEHGGETLDYIEVTPADITLANRLANDVLGRTLDELPPQTRRLLHLIHAYVTERAAKEGVDTEDVRFTRREVREASGWGHTQLKVHLHRLEEMEYLIAHQGGRGQRFLYELAYNSDGGETFLPGLIDAAALDVHMHHYDDNRSGVKGHRSESSRPQVGGLSGPGRPAENGANPHGARAPANRSENRSQTTTRSQKPTLSHRSRTPQQAPSLAALGKA